MPKYSVIVPFSGHIEVSVEATDAQEAIDTAFELDIRIEISGDGGPRIEDWEMHRHVGRGNLCEFSSPWDAEAEEIEE
jgi:hypothetical protein